MPFATEQYKFLSQSTLSGGINNSTTTVAVADATQFPSTAQFALLVDSELMLCTGISGNTLTVTRGAEGSRAPAASHSSGAAVTLILTPRSMLNNPLAMTTAGDIPYLGTTGLQARLPIGPDGYILGASGGLPTWVPATAGGTVTSIATNATLTASPSPITSTGTLGINLANANTWMNTITVGATSTQGTATINLRPILPVSGVNAGAMTVIGTFPDATTGNVSGTFIGFTQPGVSLAKTVYTLECLLSSNGGSPAWYTPTHNTNAGFFENFVETTLGSFGDGASGCIGLEGRVHADQGSTDVGGGANPKGWSYGISGWASHCLVNIGMSGYATHDLLNTNVGGAAIATAANNGGFIGTGFYSQVNKGTFNSSPTFVNTALLLDNAATGLPLIIGYGGNGGPGFINTQVYKVDYDGSITTGIWKGTVVGSTYGGTGVNNGASTITLGGSMTLAGAFTFTGTLTATTAVTFPTTGTLAGLENANTWTGIQQFQPTTTLASSASLTWNGLNVPTTTLTLSGSTNITTTAGLNLVSIAAPSYSAGTALTVTNAATFTILGAPSGAGAGPATITNPYALWVQAGNSKFGTTTTAGTATTTISPTMSGSSTTSNVVNITATMPSTLTQQTSVIYNSFAVTSSSAKPIVGYYMEFDIASGYTGSLYAVGFYVFSESAGTRTASGIATYNGVATGNMAFFGQQLGTTVGANAGGSFEAGNGNTNFGVTGKATGPKNSATNIGGAFFALNGGTSPTYTALYAGLQATAPTYANSVCTLDNGAVSASILLCRVNGTTGLTIDSNANIVQASGKTLTLGNSATTGLTPGVLAATTNATIVITDNAGQAYRIPCII